MWRRNLQTFVFGHLIFFILL